MKRKKILFICGSLNQTTQLHKISLHLCGNFDCYFTPYYVDSLFLKLLYKNGLLNFTVAGEKLQNKCLEYLISNDLKIDFCGNRNNYDLVITSSDLVIQKNIRGKKIILVQEGMTDPENIFFWLSKWFNLPRYLASTSTTGLSDKYKIFCVASHGYRDLFVRKGANPSKIIVTGIPNFDNFKIYLNNTFRYRNHVLAATSDARETFKYENRKKFIKKVLEIADGRQIIFKLHPNENHQRAEKEISAYAPEAIIFRDGNINHMIANCEILVTKYSSVVYAGISLGKEVYSDFDIDMLKKLNPIQNGGLSARYIAEIATLVIEEYEIKAEEFSYMYSSSAGFLPELAGAA